VRIVADMNLILAAIGQSEMIKYCYFYANGSKPVLIEYDLDLQEGCEGSISSLF
jgi:hypothetical protein